MLMHDFERRQMTQDDPHWAVFSLADASLQIDLGRAGLILSEEAFRVLTNFVTMAISVPLRGTVTSTTTPQCVIGYCQQTNTMTLGIEQTLFRFRPAEFERFVRLCRHAVETLEVATRTGSRAHARTIARN